MKLTDNYPIIGMSPGNSYFNDETIRYLMKEVIKKYGKTAILIADIPAISTYIALGYPENEARNKAIPKGNNLKNKTRRIMAELGLSNETVHIIEWGEEVASNNDFQAHYQNIQHLYASNIDFASSVNQTTQTVLEGYGRPLENMEAAIKLAAHYLLSEIAFLEFAPQLLGSTNIVYIYHKNWPIYENYIAGKIDGIPKTHLGFRIIRYNDK